MVMCTCGVGVIMPDDVGVENGAVSSRLEVKSNYNSENVNGFIMIDCRTCMNRFGMYWPGQCNSTYKCTKGNQYQGSNPIILWD